MTLRSMTMHRYEGIQRRLAWTAAFLIYVPSTTSSKTDVLCNTKYTGS